LPRNCIDHLRKVGGIKFRSVSVRFRIPAGIYLSRSWKADVLTTGSQIILTLTPSELRIEIPRGLLIDVFWPGSNVMLYGITYDFGGPPSSLPLLGKDPLQEFYQKYREPFQVPRIVQGKDPLREFAEKKDPLREFDEILEKDRGMSRRDLREILFKSSMGYLSNIDVQNTQTIAIGLKDDVRAEIRSMVKALLEPTRFSKVGYNPLNDPDLKGGLDELMRAFSSVGSSNSVIAPANLTGLDASITFELQQDIRPMTAKGGIEIPAGTSITLGVELRGTAADVLNKRVDINSVEIMSDGIFVLQNDRREAILKHISILRGCQVVIRSVEAVPGGTMSKGESLEVVFRLLGAMIGAAAKANGSNGAFRLYLRDSWQRGAVNSKSVDGFARSEIEKALTDAVRDIYRQSYNALSARLPAGMSLDKIFGRGCRRVSARSSQP
jgi:hypothetical protein